MATKAKTKTISFTEKYKREYNYISSIRNASEYVCELIKKDLDSKDRSIEKQIETLQSRLSQ